MSLSEVSNLDCMLGMAQYPDKYFELAVVDPQFGIGADKAQNNTAKQRIKADGKSKAGRGWKLYHDTDWDNEIPTAEYWTELSRVSKNQIVWGGNYFTEYLNPSMGWLVWNKVQRGFSLSDGELAWTSFNKALRIFDYARGNESGFAPKLRGVERAGINIHPTQKPIKLYDWIFMDYAKQGDKILDTHLGSGSSRISAHKAGLDFTGYELDKDYFEASEKRFQIYLSQQDLFIEKVA